MEKIKKYDSILLWIGIALFSAIITFGTTFSISDEVWNFQNLYKMVNGYQIYQDANVIITPIFYWIGEIVLRLFGANYFIYRLYNVVIYSFMMVIVYNIFKQLKISRIRSFIYALIIYSFIHLIIPGGANYNILAVMWVLLGIYISLKEIGTKKFNILNGIMIYLILFTKQNIGIYYFISTVIMQLIINGRNKKTYLDIIKQMGTTTILSFLSLGILFVQGNLWHFINYAFLGIGEFSSKNIGIEIESLFIGFMICMMISIAIWKIKDKVKKEEKQNMMILFCIGMGMILIIYPIVNLYHVLIGILGLIILILYTIDTSIKDFFNKKIIQLVMGIIMLITILFCLRPMIDIIRNQKLYIKEYENPYYGAIIKDELKENINIVNSYITGQEEKVIILSKDAAIYNIPAKRNNGMMDLPFLGNLGYNGEDNLIQELDKKKGYQVLIKEPIHYQESEKVVEHIKEKYNHIGEIEEFQIYEIN